MEEAWGIRLEGEELIKKICELQKNNSTISSQDLAIETGYFTFDKEGNKVPNTLEFINAIIEYKISKKYEKKRGAKPKNQLKVHRDGKIIIGKSYIEKAGLKPGMIVNLIIMRQGKIIIQVKQKKK